jgi:hypothetical protein
MEPVTNMAPNAKAIRAERFFLTDPRGRRRSLLRMRQGFERFDGNGHLGSILAFQCCSSAKETTMFAKKLTTRLLVALALGFALVPLAGAGANGHETLPTEAESPIAETAMYGPFPTVNAAVECGRWYYNNHNDVTAYSSDQQHGSRYITLTWRNRARSIIWNGHTYQPR